MTTRETSFGISIDSTFTEKPLLLFTLVHVTLITYLPAKSPFSTLYEQVS